MPPACPQGGFHPLATLCSPAHCSTAALSTASSPSDSRSTAIWLCSGASASHHCIRGMPAQAKNSGKQANPALA